MFSKIVAFFRKELADPSVRRGILVVMTLIGIKYGLAEVHADAISTAIWSFVTIALSRAPGKEQP